METKTLNEWLVIDWKKGKTRTRKSKPSAGELGTNELLAQLSVNIEVPEVETPTLPIQVSVPEARVEAAALEGIPEEDLPDWTSMVDQKVEDRETVIKESETTHDLRSVVMEIVAETLMDCPGRPDANTVEEYTHEVVVEVSHAE